MTRKRNNEGSRFTFSPHNLKERSLENSMVRADKNGGIELSFEEEDSYSQ